MRHVKDSSYFSHDFNAGSDPKVRAMIATNGIESYGIYWIAVEEMASNPDYKLPCEQWVYIAIADKCSLPVEMVKEHLTDMILKFPLFNSDGKFFWSESLLRRMKMREEHSRRLSEAGRKGAEKTNKSRPGRGLDSARPRHKNGQAAASKVKESKVKESKVRSTSLASKESIPTTNTADAAYIRKGMVYFRCSDREYSIAAEWFRKKGLNTALIPLAAEIIDNWLQSDTPAAKKARKQDSHYRRLYSPGFIDEAQRLLKIQQGGASRTRFEAAMNEIDSAFGSNDSNVIDVETAR